MFVGRVKLSFVILITSFGKILLAKQIFLNNTYKFSFLFICMSFMDVLQGFRTFRALSVKTKPHIIV